MDRFMELEVFTRIADEANLTRTAEALGLSVSSVSRCLTSLENRLGVRLVQRTTRQLLLTSEGENFARYGREILESLQVAEDSVSLVSTEPRGTIRIGSSLSFALLHLMPVIQIFEKENPMVRIELQISNRYLDIIENGLDLAIRTRLVETDSSVTIRKLARTPRLLAASPDYIKQNGMPSDPDDLHKQAMLLYTLADNWDHLTFMRDGTSRTLRIEPRMTCNDGQVIRQGALAGMGILVQPAYIIKQDLDAGRLVQVLKDWTLEPLTMNVAFPTRRHLAARTRLFIDSLVQYFRDNDIEGSWSDLS